MSYEWKSRGNNNKNKNKNSNNNNNNVSSGLMPSGLMPLWKEIAMIYDMCTFLTNGQLANDAQHLFKEVVSD